MLDIGFIHNCFWVGAICKNDIGDSDENNPFERNNSTRILFYTVFQEYILSLIS